MRFAFTEEQEALRATARAFLAEHSSSEQVRRAMQSELGFAPELWKTISAQMNWPAVCIPEEYGGLGLGDVELVALLEVMGEALLCAPFFSSVCLGANALRVAGSDAQKRELLPAIAEGRTLATLAAFEPDKSWRADGIEAEARRQGGDYLLSGRKRFVLDGHCADLIVVAARREGRLLDLRDPREGWSGLELRLELAQHGLRGFGDHLHRAVGHVSREPRDPEVLGQTQREVAIAHALHAALDQVAVGRHGA